ncbi:MAG: (2Fe-2S)-binding protein [Actinobacteria bacterium]|nr:(2Fe-2S)-binding protein [Actinomycetota bacterium]
MRLPRRDGETIDRDDRRTFTFDGKEVQAYAGDTIGSALYANGQRIFTRSFKYHRPRGLSCAAGNCAGCLMEVDGEPSVKACTRTVQGGEVVRSQTISGSLERDPMRVVDHVAGPVTPVGFYYRLGIRPKAAWPHIERMLRRMTGLGRVGEAPPKPHRADVEHRTAGVLVIGAGRSGQEAAARYAAEGRQVILVDERAEYASLAIDGVEVIAPGTALGVYEGRLVPVHADGLMHRIRAEKIVVATGSIDQPLLFEGNDLPGVMTPSAVRRLVGLWSIRPGTRAVVLAADEAGDEAARLLREAGTQVVETIDLRGVRPPKVKAAARHGLLAAVEIDGRKIDCDLLVASAGRQPAYSLLAQSGCSVRFDAEKGIFAPDQLVDGVEAAGSVTGEGAAVLAAAEGAGKRTFVCPCEDVTAKDLVRAVGEGFEDIEIAKRYTTVTMGPCQGRLCHLHSVRALARATGVGEAALGTTTARPPWQPTPLGDVGGRKLNPGKRTALHDANRRAGAQYVWTGVWRRPDHYGDAAAEIKAVHEGVGLMDVSTLGKLYVSGPDAEAFLDGVFPNRISTLKVDRVRYGIFNTDSGRIIDDGTIIRVGERDFLVTTSSGGVDQVYEAFLLWVAERKLAVDVVNVSGALSAVSLSGPKAREVLSRVTDVDVANEAFKFLDVRQGAVAGASALLMRIGFLGELGYEIHFPSTAAEHVWEALMKAGAEFGILPLGVEALKALRLEKGHIIVGIDTDSETTMLECGMGPMIAWDKGEFVGNEALGRMNERGADRALVGFTADDLPNEGTAVLVGGEVGGRVTSARRSAVSGQVIGLAYVPAAIGSEGSAFELDLGEGRRGGAKVHIGAFYDPDGERMRG